MPITKISDGKDLNKYDDVIDETNDEDSTMIFLKMLSIKIDEIIEWINAQE